MSDISLFTYQDATEHAADSLGAASQSIDARHYRRAASEALRDLANQRDWWCYREKGLLTTVASYATGTIAYDHSGGVDERQVTLTSGTWPEWAAYGVLVISGVRYTVATRESDSVITLSPLSNPGTDVASGTSYTLYRDAYPVPTDFKKIVSTLYDATSHREISRSSDRETLRTTRLTGASEPFGYAIVGDSNYQGGLAFELSPPPSSARNYDYIYQRNPRPLVLEQEATGTVTVTAAGSTVTGSGTAFTDAMVGSVIRVSASTTAPTGRYGSNPYDQERVILERVSATSLVVDAAWDTSRAAVKYVISDPVDLEPGAMLNAYLRGIEAKLGHLRSKEDRAISEAAYQDELRRAASADSRDGSPRGVGGTYSVSWPALRARYGTVE